MMECGAAPRKSKVACLRLERRGSRKGSSKRRRTARRRLGWDVSGWAVGGGWRVEGAVRAAGSVRSSSSSGVWGRSSSNSRKQQANRVRRVDRRALVARCSRDPARRRGSLKPPQRITGQIARLGRAQRSAVRGGAATNGGRQKRAFTRVHD